MIHEVFMPALSSTMTEGKIVSWSKSPGDKVAKGETVLVVESDKADMDVESFYEGYLATILVDAGQEAPVGAALALIAETEAEIETAKHQANGAAASAPTAPTTPTPAPASEPAASAPPAPAPAVAVATPAAPAAAPSQRNGRTIASPRARKLAKEYGVDLAAIAGSGPHGRIIAGDVEAAAGQSAPPAAVPAIATPGPVAAPPSAPAPTPAPATPGELEPFTTLQSAVVRNMMVSLQVPTFHVGYTFTTDELDKLYKQIKPKGVTMTALLAKAVAVTLQKHPIVNAAYTETGTQYSGSINIAVAVAMPGGGLITPVLQNADRLDIYTLSRTWKDLVARARSKQLQPEEYSSGTFSLSNLGTFGVDRFDAILPPGTGSILAVGASRPQLVATDDGTFGVRRQMSVNMTCDHRIIYGAHAAAFLQDLAKLVEANATSLTM
ncbi:pyruvate/2-oxoglutarate dehydrogenase complex [Rubidibacter lacunae KORDI 51-2]|uniref:Dihydrolipoamide acetyltransferase component of pyruvate dehydrogenase complex n=1 Tax=Rubidibacter lacunae KORDI 51-2 TaxID=582515 RepID=U5DHC0_9CHRO|nr:dihydrolipoamide acetyltransferase family protein [Rubidibacter lacunae]ERN41006.1 pyruvate/2-oxoglutarate dehydrogenase complex [Rubidibacter lacunae KORDI 51-2]